MRITEWLKSKLKSVWVWLLVIFGIGIFGAGQLTTPKPLTDITPLDKMELAKYSLDIKYTDDNTNETVLIKTDKEKYNQGLREDTVYFSMTNTADDEYGYVKFLSEKPLRLLRLEQYSKTERTVFTPVYDVQTYECASLTACERWTQSGTTSSVVYEDVWTSVPLLKSIALANDLKKPTGDALADKQVRLFLKKGETAFYRARLGHELGEYGEFFIEWLGDTGYGLLDPLFGNDGGGTWTKKAEIRIDPNKVDGASHASFPILITGATVPSTLFTTAQANGCDIRVSANSDGTAEMPIELVHYTAGSSIMELWTATTSLSGTATTSIYIWYGNSSATCYAVTDTYGSQAVWNSNYTVVSHCQGNMNDSTANGNNFSQNNVRASTTPNKFGSASRSFPNNNDWASTTIDIGSSITVQTWVYVDSWQTNQGRFMFKHSGAAGRHMIGSYIQDDNDLEFDRYNGSLFAMADTAVKTTGGWVKYDFVASSTGIAGIASGTPYETTVRANPVDNPSTVFIIGSENPSGTAAYFTGAFEELRIVNTNLANEWISTEWNNQNSPATFAYEQAEEDVGTAAPAPKYQDIIEF